MTVQFLTRVPVPRVAAESEMEMGKATAFFPLVGVLVGAAAALVFWLLQKIVPVPTAVLGAIIFTVIVTNAFHEDGLADTFDGFGGGWTRERVLEIMRDSRIGTYGGVALILSLLLRRLMTF